MKLFLSIVAFVFFTNAFAQKDTLRLYYSGLSVKLLDSNEVKIGEWAKQLAANKTEVEIHAYYDKNEFKDIAEQRIGDIALVVTRKARDYTNIVFQGPKKATKSKRSCVDIIYTKPNKLEEKTETK